jgi:hypothetical protein
MMPKGSLSSSGFSSLTVAILLLISLFSLPALAASSLEIQTKPSNDTDSISIATGKSDAAVVVDSSDYPVVQLAANLFADDVQRVTGRHPIVTNTPFASRELIVVGTLGKSALIEKLISDGKLNGIDQIRGHWEATLSEIVSKPFPGVERALVIIGSDRRGAAYGLMHLSQKIGVSPWYWWADVPVRHHDVLAIKVATPQVDAPGVKYRGVFINDEDWGINPWAAKTFDREFKNIGPKTYEKVFELMLRLRLNYLWPAMHGCSAEFGSVPENVALADKFGIVAGSSHCEPMLCNNVHWNEREKGRWNYSLNRDTIHSYWEENVRTRGTKEAVWTLGIRGIHDAGMQSPPNDLPGRMSLIDEVFRDQRELLNHYVTKEWGPVAQCFVPYKEVLPIYDAGLKVPDDVTLVWVDDNFGYIRRLSSPTERSRSGGSGVYWHLSYYGGPHSYTWINTTAPALMWEELHKAWENDARTIWMINVGDIKPMEIGVDYFSRLAWNPDSFPLGAQRQFLADFLAANFGEKPSRQMTGLLMDYYRLGTVRKPELMERSWALSLTRKRANQLEKDYQELLDRERSLARAVPIEVRDAYTELIGFPVRVLGLSGQIFLADRSIQEGRDVQANEKKITSLRRDLEAQVGNFNTNLAGGKWNRMMPGLVTGKNLTAWNSQVRWPWGEPQATNNPAVELHKSTTQTAPATSSPSMRSGGEGRGEVVSRVSTNHTAATRAPDAEQNWRDAGAADRQVASGAARWSAIEGLGPSGKAVALQPASLNTSLKEDDAAAPTLEFDFKSKANDTDAWVDFLPTFRLYPGMKLRVAVSVDKGAPILLEVPGSSGAENENGQVRSLAVQNNFVRAHVPLPQLAAGKHTFKIHAMDPGVVIDRIWLP